MGQLSGGLRFAAEPSVRVLATVVCGNWTAETRSKISVEKNLRNMAYTSKDRTRLWKRDASQRDSFGVNR
jgi:hypothetical protein